MRGCRGRFVNLGCGCFGLIVVFLVGSLLLNITVLTAGSVQKYFPKPADYRYTNTLPQALRMVSDVAEAVNLDGLVSGPFGTAGKFLVCYQQAGAADVYFYVKNNMSESGMLAVINASEAGSFFMDCMQQALDRSPQACFNASAFIDNATNELIVFVYTASPGSLCDIFINHLAQFQS